MHDSYPRAWWMHLSVIVVTARVSHLHAHCLPHTAYSLAGHFTSLYQLNFISDNFNAGTFLRRWNFLITNKKFYVSETTFVWSAEMVGMWVIDRRYINCIWIQIISILCSLNQFFLSIYKTFDKSYTLSNFSMIPGDGLFVNYWSTLYQLDLNQRDFNTAIHKLTFVCE
jgi:hypothetical protein